MSNNDYQNQRPLKRRERLTSSESSSEKSRRTNDKLSSFPQQMVKDAWDQLLGVRKQAQELDQNLAIEQTALQKEKERLQRQVTFERLKVREQRRLGLREKEDTRTQVKELREKLKQEIARLDMEVQQLSQEVTVISVEQDPQDAGIYHINFFQWIFESINLARKKVQNAATWLVVWQSKSAKQRGMLFGFKGNKGPKSCGAGVHRMIGGEMGSARSGA